MPVKEIALNYYAMYLSLTNLYIKAYRHSGVSKAYMSDTFRKVISRELWKLYKINYSFQAIKKQVDSIGIVTHEVK